MILRNTDQSIIASLSAGSDLGSGSISVLGFAQLAARALAGNVDLPQALSNEALVLLYLARDRGIFEMRAQPDAFDSTERLLAVSVEFEEGRWKVFRQKSNPRKTVAYLDAFRELCQGGLVLHHSLREFSLTKNGFSVAAESKPNDLDIELEWANVLEFA